MKEYLESEIQNLEEDIKDLAERIEEMKSKQQYKTGRQEAYKSALEHFMKEVKIMGDNRIAAIEKDDKGKDIDDDD